MTDRHHAPAHSVAQHLHLDIREYDRIIRTFIPGYDQMFDVVAGRLADAGPRGGFLNADVTIPREPDAAAAAYRRWADHMVTNGIPETEAWRNFDSWGSEDRYFSLEEELAALGSAGFQEPECLWRLGPATV